MATDVDIVNLALAHLADETAVTAISVPDQTVEGQSAARYYPLARDIGLTRFPWAFATAREALVTPSGITLPNGWNYVYSVPSDNLRIMFVRDSTETNSNYIKGYPFILEMALASGGTTRSQVIYTNANNGEANYVFRQEDATQFSIEFVMALSYELAALLAGSILRDRQVAQAMAQEAEVGYAQARLADSNSQDRRLMQQYVPSSIAVRGGTTPANA